MDGYRVFLWGWVDRDHVVRALGALRGFDTIDGPVGAVDVFGVRSGVLVELAREGRNAVQVRFVDAGGPGDAWTQAHSFLWIATRRLPVDEALLIGGPEPLHFCRGRIHPVGASEEQH
ncbi:hypothetical protein [Saccharopolyspora taberi]|uniref:Uncharacterized protein n=1 Tax=Saccharopolyspora taberi TaxID=60895 RepID=A0ABN3VMY7_9PSEU